MTFTYKAPTAFMGATTLVLLLSGFKGISHNSLTTSHLVYSGLGASTETVAWFNIPLPPPPDEPKPAGSREGLLCLLTPSSTDGSVSTVWSNSPQFVWAEKFLDPDVRGSVDQIAVVLPNSQTVVWSQRVTDGEASTTTTSSAWRLEQLAYNGEALQPGQTYQWVTLDRRQRPLESGVFQVMPLAKQQAITAKLIALEETMANHGATAEEIAAEKALYFAEQHLWTDAVQTAFSVEDPSHGLAKFQSQLPERRCAGL
ncbi:hypothetical protein C7293_04160 [filamentous cyanobacterium CCT1]|nr:hypothetical protein C7293_04160 [filamentous cyanobacterium CCT1]PSN80219.1 hypothetical protein C8B47_07675 [filamentous cyanobacterium CCP4]